jgi:hypothetical protein
LLAIGLGSYYSDAVRRIAPGEYLLIGHRPFVGVPPARCLPKHERAERKKLLRQARAGAAALTYCLSTLRIDSCWPVTNLTSEADIAVQELESDHVQEIVPDDVSTVVLTYRSGESQTISVSNNILNFNVPAALARPVRATQYKIDAILAAQIHKNGRPLSRAQKHALAADRRHEQREERQLVPAAVVWRTATGVALRTLRPVLVPPPAWFLPSSVVKIGGPSTPSCSGPSSGSGSSCLQAIAGSGPASLVSALGVLRRPQLQSDVLPAISEVSLQLPIDLASYYPAATRQLAHGVYLIVGNEQTALAGSGSSTVRLADRHPRRQHATAHAGPLMYCLSTLIQANCQPLSNLTSDDDVAIQVAHGGTASELVPDGVSTVNVSYRDGKTQTVAVANNLVQFAAPANTRTTLEAQSLTINNLDTVLINHPGPQVAERDRIALSIAVSRYTRTLKRVVPKRIVWRDPDGAIVRTLAPPLTDGFGVLGLATGT